MLVRWRKEGGVHPRGKRYYLTRLVLGRNV
jgi:hypothetical protein